MSSSSSTTAAPSVLIPIAEKLHRSNFNIWRAQALATIHGAQLITYLDPEREEPAPKLSDKDGKATNVPNPAYEIDRDRDSQVLSFIFNSMSPAMMIQVTHCTKADVAWIARCSPPTCMRPSEGHYLPSQQPTFFQIYMWCTSTLYLLNYSDEFVSWGS